MATGENGPELGGYDYDFTSRVPEDWECPVCCLTLKDPVQIVGCGHRLCNICIGSLLRSSLPRCPVDRQPLSREKIFPDAACHRKILNLAVRCPHSGCSWNRELRAVEEHQSECLFKVVKCSNSGCTKMLSKRDMKTHETLECSWRKVDCEYCQESVIVNQKQKHFEICRTLPVLCTNKCGLRDIPREKLEAHILDECPATKVQCEYKNLGCEEVFPRSAAKSHSETQIESHLSLTLRGLEATQYHVHELFTAVNKQSQGIKRQSQQLERKSQQIELQSQWIELQSQQLEQQSQQIELQSQQIKEVISKDKEQSQQIDRQSQQIERQSQQIKEVISKDKEQSQQIERQSQQIERQSQQIERQSQQIERQLQQIERQSQQIEKLISKDKEQSQQIERQSQQIKKLISDKEQSQQIEKQSQQIERQSQQIERQSQQIERQSQQIEKLIPKDKEQSEKMERPMSTVQEQPLQREGRGSMNQIFPTPFEWKINFTEDESQTLFSEPFYLFEGGYKYIMKISLFEMHCTVSIKVVPGEFDDSLSWPCKEKVLVEMFSGQHRIYRKSGMIDFEKGKEPCSRPLHDDHHEYGVIFVLNKVLQVAYLEGKSTLLRASRE